MDPTEPSTQEIGTNVTFQVNPDDVCQLIQLAREFHAQDSVVFENEPESLTDDLVFDALERHGEDPVIAEFRNIIADLDRPKQVQIVTLMWVARGDYDLGDWQQALEVAEDEWTDYTADYLLAHPLVADYLNDGLEMLGYHCD